MPKTPIIDFSRSYTFRNYFELPYEPEDILAEFDYTLQRAKLNLPKSDLEFTEQRFTNLRERIDDILPYVSFTSEAARRELLIAPILVEVVRLARAQLRIEYPLIVTDQLKGSLDYYLYNTQKFLVIEAKNADLARGFTQLAVELIALDKWNNSNAQLLYGAVTTGEVWQFGLLEKNKQIIQDLNLYPVPIHLESLLRILVAILI